MIALGVSMLVALVLTVLGVGLAVDRARAEPNTTGWELALIVLSGTFLPLWGPLWAVRVAWRALRVRARRALLRAAIAAMQDNPELRRQLRSALSD